MMVILMLCGATLKRDGNSRLLLFFFVFFFFNLKMAFIMRLLLFVIFIHSVYWVLLLLLLLLQNSLRLSKPSTVQEKLWIIYMLKQKRNAYMKPYAHVRIHGTGMTALWSTCASYDRLSLIWYRFIEWNHKWHRGI